MGVRIPRDYLTLAEIRDRWKLPPDSLDVHRAVLKGILRPSVFVGEPLRIIRMDSGHPVVSDATSDAPGWAYVQGLRQVGAFDCTASAVSLTPDPQGDGDLFALDVPLSMADLFKVGVVMADDLDEAERQLAASGQDMSTKERASLLKLVSILLVECYRYDPRRRNAVAAEISEAGTGMGLEIAENTVMKFMRMAYTEHPPALSALAQRI